MSKKYTRALLLGKHVAPLPQFRTLLSGLKLDTNIIKCRQFRIMALYLRMISHERYGQHQDKDEWPA